MLFNAEIELSVQADRLGVDALSDLADELIGAMREFSASVGRGPSGRVQVTLTIEAHSIEVATGVAWTVIHQACPSPVYTFHVLPTDEFDRRYGLVDA